MTAPADELLDVPGAVTIPLQLRTDEFRFIRVIAGTKGEGGNEVGFNTTANYAWDDPRLVAHLANGGNYGVFPREGSGNAILDVDDYPASQAAHLLDELEGQTFTVETGGSRPEQPRFHIFIRCTPPLSGKHSLHAADGTKLADFYAQNPGYATGYVVGANSLHRTGERYRVACDMPIKAVDGDILAAVIERLTKKKRKALPSPSPHPSTRGLLSDQLGLRCSEFLMPLSPIPRGEEVEGEHPIHGSDTGTNLTLSPDNKWWCRRCQTGGGPLEALAVAEGIIDCHEAGPGCLKDHWREVMDALRRRGYDPDSKRPADQEPNVGLPHEPEPAPAPTPEPELVSAAMPRGARLDDGDDLKVAAALDLACKDYNMTDSGNADRLVKRYGHKLRYCAPRQAWYTWDGHRWREDRHNTIMRLARQTARRIYAEVAREAQDKRRSHLAGWASTSESKERLKGMIILGASDPDVAVVPDDLDADGNLFNLQNGTLELDTLTFRAPRKEDLLTKIAGVAYDKAATCPRWEGHLRLIFNGDEELVRSTQELLAYAMLEGNPQQIFPIWHGGGQNGKSVTLSVMRTIFGEYAVTAPPGLFMSVKDNGGPRPDLLGLRGARLVIAAETKRGQRLNEELIKQMTGGERLKVRGLYKEYEEFAPSHLAILATNPRPVVSGEFAIMRRIILWPFSVRIPEEQRVPDYEKELLKEAPGILNWLITGLRRYYENDRRLTVPTAADAATNEYKAEMDTLTPFIVEECMMDEAGVVPRKVMYDLYFNWCTELGTEAMGMIAFADALKERGIVAGPKINGTRHWKGIRPKKYDEYKNEDSIASAGDGSVHP